MDFSPLEIQKKEFSKALRGYNTEEVDEFIDKLLENYERIYKENRDLKEQIELLKEKMQSYKDIEATLKNTLVLAEKTAEEIKNNAEKEREAVLREASIKAKEILHIAKQQFNQINDKNEQLKQQFYLYKIRFKNFLQSQLDYLDTLELDMFPDNDLQNEVELEAAAANEEEVEILETGEELQE